MKTNFSINITWTFVSISIFIQNCLTYRQNPGIFISTREAFSNITPRKSKDLFEIIKSGTEPDFDKWKENVSNDFEAYILKNYAKIRGIKVKMEEAGALFTQMSGTGSTVYGFFESIGNAENCAASMPEDYLTFISCA